MDLTQLLTFAVDNGAEAALVWANSPPVLRMKGKLVFTKMESLTAEGIRALVVPALSDREIDELERRREVRFTRKVREDCHVLASVYFERGSLCAVFRFAPPAAAAPSKLGLPSLIAEAVRAPQGLVLIVAPPGHGKSTTLASLVELINSEREAVVLTIEKNIIHPHASKLAVVHQREVGRDAVGFAEAIAGAAGQDPDVLVVDPLEEGEPVRRALAFAGRGRLVVASMEADYVLEAIEKLLRSGQRNAKGEIDPESALALRRQLAASLTLVAALRLLPRKDGAGRVPATELLKVDAAVAALIREGDLDALRKRMKSPQESSTWTLDSFILKLHERGLVDAEAAKRYLLSAGGLEA
jgi:twitching motility protein PilT